MRYLRTRVALGIGLAGLIAIFTGCASSGAIPDYDGERTAKDATLCLQSGPCTVIQIENRGFSDAVVYLNDSRIAFAPGNGHTTIFVSDIRLGADHCASLAVRLIAGPIARSSKECLRRGGYFTLDIDPSSALMPLHIWLVPRGV